MKLSRFLFVFVIAAALVASAAGQETKEPLASANKEALGKLQQDLQSAVKSLDAALPIYKGDRELALRAANKALAAVDKAINGKSDPKSKLAHDHSKASVGVKYTQQQITESQTNMQAGLNSLNLALKDLEAAVGPDTNKSGHMVSNHIKTAIKDASKALSEQPVQP
jgi:hypothetical protein